jgi:multiple sugar transport system substrate-binding protein
MEMTAFAAGAMADVFQPFTEVIPDLARTSRAVAMDPYVEVSKIVKKENYSDPIWAFFVQKGKLYGVPWRNDIRATQYMKSALEKSGAKPPTDFDTLVAAAKAMTKKEGDKITQAGYDPFAAPPYGPTQRFAPFLWSLGGEMLTPDGRKSAFNSDEGVAAVNFLVELHQAVWPNPEATLEQAPIPHIATGRLVMSAGGTGIAAQLAQYAPDKVADLEIVVPPVKGRGPKAATYGLAFPSPWCMSTKGKAKNPDAAWTLVEYLSEPLVAAEANKASMNAPVNKHVQALPYYANDKHWPKYLELGNKWNKNMPSWPRTFELYKSLSDLISEVWFKKKTAKDALKEAAAVWDPVLEKEGY